MAKKRKKKNAAPKRIAGVKLSKPLRRGLNELLASKRGRQLMADALLAAGAAVVAKKTHAGSKAARLMEDGGPAEGAKETLGAVASTGSALSYALGEASRSFVEALQRGKAMADAKAAWPEVEESAPPKKPPAKPEASPTH